MKTTPSRLTAGQFEELFQSVCNWGKWGPEDELGTLNYITPDKIRSAARLVRSGRTVSLAIPIDKVAGPDNPQPAFHAMVQTFDVSSELGEPRVAMDYLACQCHGDCHTHMDALCHIGYRGKLYNGKPIGEVTSHGAGLLDITNYAHGVVGRGVLLDIPRLRDVPWLEPGEAVSAEELEAAERAQGVRLEEGDILAFRTGHYRRRLERGPWNNGYDGEGKAGLHAAAMLLLHERKVAAFLPDGDGETVPSNVEGVAYPVHLLQINAMGMACADSLQFEDLAPICAREKRWEFLVVAVPLRLPQGTGSLANPIAIL
jgi:kynurenine formamidase